LLIGITETQTADLELVQIVEPAEGCLDHVVKVGYRRLARHQQTPPPRRHELAGKRAGQFTLDLTANWRLIFRPDHDPVPRSSGGGVDLTAVTDIVIIEIVDYHGN